MVGLVEERRESLVEKTAVKESEGRKEGVSKYENTATAQTALTQRYYNSADVPPWVFKPKP